MDNLFLSPQRNLQELFRDCPQVMPIFIRHRMACVGCCMSRFDTLQEAAQNYGLELKAFCLELRAAMDQTVV